MAGRLEKEGAAEQRRGLHPGLTGGLARERVGLVPEALEEGKRFPLTKEATL